MSIRLYIGNLPQTFEEQELVALLKSVGEGIRFKSVLDRETGACRGFGFANVDDPKLADAGIEALNGKEQCWWQPSWSPQCSRPASSGPQGREQSGSQRCEERGRSRPPLGRRTVEAQGSAGQPEDGGLIRR